MTLSLKIDRSCIYSFGEKHKQTWVKYGRPLEYMYLIASVSLSNSLISFTTKASTVVPRPRGNSLSADKARLQWDYMQSELLNPYLLYTCLMTRVYICITSVRCISIFQPSLKYCETSIIWYMYLLRSIFLNLEEIRSFSTHVPLKKLNQDLIIQVTFLKFLPK